MVTFPPFFKDSKLTSFGSFILTKIFFVYFHTSFYLNKIIKINNKHSFKITKLNETQNQKISHHSSTNLLKALSGTILIFRFLIVNYNQYIVIAQLTHHQQYYNPI